jgi:hypothetical protein
MLTDQARAILRFEEAWEGVSGNREAAIRNTFGVSAAGYFQQLYKVLDDPVALEAEPMLVKRLNRVRYRRFAARSRTYSQHVG